MSDHDDSAKQRHVAVATTKRPDTEELEEGTPLPEELTGRASETNEDLTTLFANEGAQHLADGYRGGSGDDDGSDLAPEPDTGVSDIEGHRKPTLDE